MRTDRQLAELPKAKFNRDTLASLYGKNDITPMWLADMEFEVVKPVQDALIDGISGSGFDYMAHPHIKEV